ncbi:OmpA family protein, partial [Paraglaciecola sp.]|uniref:OmpA family protein n=1 Tax=Paraglaciecola sp. TaxID=1920173 RepID=UPI0030F44312
QLESNQDLASQSPLAMKEARDAVLQAEQRQKDPAMSDHLVFIAQRKVDIAETESKKLYLEEQRSEMSAKRDAMQLQARTNESKMAKQEANQAEQNAIEAQRQARLAQSDAAMALQEMNKAEQDTAQAKQQVSEMQQQLKDLDARQEARGTVVTLGDVLFDFNKAEIKPAAISHLAKLAAFLNNNIDRNAAIEGHTDNVGASDINMLLSQRRANAIKDYLQSQGVAGARMDAVGKGEEFPVTDNSTSPKRQQNRRVEVIISDPIT